jgi:hypothetical protein
MVNERVELYLYSAYGPYGLYRVSVLVHGCTLPLPYKRDMLWGDYDMHISPTTDRLLFTFEIDAAGLLSGNGLL